MSQRPITTIVGSRIYRSNFTNWGKEGETRVLRPGEVEGFDLMHSWVEKSI
jgi:hypothetical protein